VIHSTPSRYIDSYNLSGSGADESKFRETSFTASTYAGLYTLPLWSVDPPLLKRHPGRYLGTANRLEMLTMWCMEYEALY